ncbi:MAG: BatD family protein [Thiobacillus sp.]|nr:BatD family protein [Thiobacillus sp.]
MVRTLLFAAWLTSSATGAASLRAGVDPSTVTLGEPLRLTLTATELSLDTLDITPLIRQFDVFSRTLSRSADSEILVLTLYPRVAGSILVPPLQLGPRHTAALAVTVRNGGDTVPQVSTHWTLVPTQPWVNQPARLRLSICDDDSLQWTRPALPAASGRLLRELGETTLDGSQEQADCTLHHYDWALIATQSGTFTLDVPMLDATRFGQRLRFPGPGLTYRVQSLPAWLPAHVPPVKPNIVEEALPQSGSLHQPFGWRFQVAGGYSAEGLKSMLALQLRETAALRFYPPTITRAATDDTRSPLTRLDVVVYVEPRQRGTVQLPAVRLPWYDPASGQMADIALQGGSVNVHDPRRRLFGLLAAGLTGGLLLVATFWQARRMACWRRARRRGLQRIAAAQTVDQLARAVRRFSLSDTPAAASLGTWMRRLQRDARGCEVASLVAQLEAQQFGHASSDPVKLRQAFLTVLKRARPKSLDACVHRDKRTRQA